EEYERLARMIDSMLFLARAEQPSAAIELQRFALPALVEQLCDYFEGVAEERGIQLLDETEGELFGDPEMIRRALANLLANALRYGASDSPVRIVSGSGVGWRSVSVINLG
ncbi:histidine kinase, partial [Stutzerimonas stutzeri]